MGADWIASDAPDDPLDETYLRGYRELADRLEDAAVAGVIRVLVAGVRYGRECKRERDALIDAQVAPWPSGGWAVRLEYRHDGYAGGTMLDANLYHFDRREDAVAALFVSVGLDVGAENPKGA